MNNTSNPAFTSCFFSNGATSSKKMSVSRIFIKTMLSIFLIIAISAFMWALQSSGINLKWYSMGGMLAAIIISIVISVRQHWAHILVPLYTIAKGVFSGSITAYAHLKFPDLPYQAIAISLVTLMVMLVFYQTRIIVVTKKFKAVVITVVSSIFVIYIISWILSFLG